MAPYLHSMFNFVVFLFFESQLKMVILTQFGRKPYFVHTQTISAYANKKQLTKDNV